MFRPCMNITIERQEGWDSQIQAHRICSKSFISSGKAAKWMENFPGNISIRRELCHRDTSSTPISKSISPGLHIDYSDSVAKTGFYHCSDEQKKDTKEIDLWVQCPNKSKTCRVRQFI